MNLSQRSLIAAALFGALAHPVYAQNQQSDNTSATANPLGSNPSNVQLYGAVGASDTSDFYSFSVSDSRPATVRISGMNGDADLYLWGDNSVWTSSTQRGNSTEAIGTQLKPGNYFVLVYGWAGNVNYQLEVNTNGPKTSRTENLGTLDGSTGSSGRQSRQGNVAAGEGWVDYLFSLPAPRAVRVNAQVASGIGVSPQTTPMQWIVTDSQGAIDARLDAGQHVLRVFGRQGQVMPFSFTIDVAPANTNDTAGDGYQTAADLGMVRNPPVSRDEYVGHWDFDDFYRFRVPPNSVANADLTHRSGSGADLYLYDDQRKLVARSTNGRNQYETVSYNALAGGTFYLRVRTATTAGPNWEDAQYTVRAGSVPLAVSRSVTSSSRDPDGNNGINSPGLFNGGRLVERRQLIERASVGGANDPVDHLTLRVTCDNSTYRPTFVLNVSGAVNVDLDRIRPDGGQRVDNPFTQNVPISPPANQDKHGTFSYEYRFTVTPSGIGAGNYAITATHRGCS